MADHEHDSHECPTCGKEQTVVTLKLLLKLYCDEPERISAIVKDFTDLVIKAVNDRPNDPRERPLGVCVDEIARASSALQRAHGLLLRLNENGDLWSARERLAVAQRAGEDLSEAICHVFVSYLGTLSLGALFFREINDPDQFHFEHKSAKKGQK